MKMKRDRHKQLIMWMTIILLGLGTRRFGEYMPQVLGRYGGDVLWALMVYIGFGVLWRSASIGRLFAYTLMFSYLIEVSQLYQAPWINTLRGTRLGALVLGHGFLWSDLLCYTIGAVIGVLLERYILTRKTRRR